MQGLYGQGSGVCAQYVSCRVHSVCCLSDVPEGMATGAECSRSQQRVCAQPTGCTTVQHNGLIKLPSLGNLEGSK